LGRENEVFALGYTVGSLRAVKVKISKATGACEVRLLPLFGFHETLVVDSADIDHMSLLLLSRLID